MAYHYFPRTSLKLLLFLTVGFLQPLFALAQGTTEVRAATIDVAGLKIAMFSSDPHARLFFGSQAAMIETMETADEITRQPEYQFLIFFAGDNLFDDQILREDFLQFTGGEMKAEIVRILKPQKACAMHEMTLPGNVNGLVATLQTDAMDDIGSSSCVISGLNYAWAGRTSESSGEIGRSIVEFIDLLEN